MLTNLLVSLSGGLLFAFLFWRKLREDRVSSQIFSTSFYVLLGILLSYFVARKFFPTWWFWAEVFGIVCGFTLGILRFKLRFFETFEALIYSLLPWLGLVFLFDAVVAGSISSIIASIFVVYLVFLFHFLDSRYKSFVWYKSGKIGFTGLATLGVFFLARAAVALFYPPVLSFAGEAEVYLSGVAAFLVLLTVFHLARSKI